LALSTFRQFVRIDGVMAILVFVLSLILVLAGAASGYASLDLLPTGIGVLYALAGAVAVSAAVVTFAIGVMIRRIDRLTKLVGRPVSMAASDLVPIDGVAPVNEPLAAPAAVEVETRESDERLAEHESPININRAGHLPSLETTETVLETPEAPPNLIGSYSSAGANYKIFANGSIEAETSEGTFKFASMADFKRHLVERRGRQAGEEKSDLSTR
jgi:hypothetical protein